MITSTNNHIYTKEVVTTAANAYQAFKTPWRMLDFNSYACHMTPADFQHLINTCARWQPKGMTVEMNNIQLKTKITAPATQINNNLTATMQVLEDTDYNLPCSLDPMEQGKPSPIMTDPYRPLPYTYFSECTNVGAPNSYTSFYMLEQYDSEMLRCEGRWGTSHKFNCGWVDNMRMNIPMPHWFSQNRESLWGHNGDTLPIPLTDRHRRRRIWAPGPYTRNIGATTGALTAQAKTVVDNLTMAFANCTADVSANSGHGVLVEQPASEQVVNAEVQTRITNIATGVLDCPTYPSTNAANVTTTVQYSTQGLMPNMAIENSPVAYHHPIWAKAPNTDHTTMDLNPLGALMMKKPPPNIYMKVTPQPTDDPQTYENVYGTCTVSVIIDWATVPFGTKRFNPINLYSYSGADADNGIFLPGTDGKISMASNITAKQLFKLP